MLRLSSTVASVAALVAAGVRVLADVSDSSSIHAADAASSSPHAAFAGNAVRRCTMLPGAARLLLRVERDTLMPLAAVRQELLSSSAPRPTGGSVQQRERLDSLRYTPSTNMPSALVRLLDLDSISRDALFAAGVTAREPEAFIQAAPYGADCRTVRWVSAEPWVVRGDVGYANATLAPRSAWIAGVPTFVIAQAWSYPFPRQRGDVFGYTATTTVASPQARFSFEHALASATQSEATRDAADSVVTVALQRWARANPGDAEHEPIRQQLRRTILMGDQAANNRRLSRMRGRYRVSMQTDDTLAHWHFVTGDRPYYSWLDADSIRSTADIVASPFAAGYQIVGYAAGSFDSLPTSSPRGRSTRDAHLVWLAVADRPSAPGNDTVRVLRAELQFVLSAAPPSLWTSMQPFVTPDRSGATARLAQLMNRSTQELLQPRIPLTVRIGGDGNITADTTIARDGRRIRVQLTRLDTVSVTRPF